MRMRLLLLGGGNSLGQALIRLAAEEGIGFLAPRPPEEGWTADSLAALMAETQPDAVVNLAFYHDWLQSAVADTMRTALQLQTVERLAELCQQQGVIFLQPSSYRVFDGSKATAYGEQDEAHPLGVLGKALWNVEQRVRHLCPRHVILRYGWLLDDSPDGRMARFLRQAERPGELYLADDRRGSPTLVDDAARVMIAVLKQLDCQAPLWGTYHYGGHEATTSLVLGQALLEAARECATLPATQVVAQAHSQRPDAAEEPQHAVLACRKILHAFGIKPRSWRAGLPALLVRYYRRS